MEKLLKRTWAEIDLDALEYNYNNIKDFSGGREIIAIVKADAYGHDDKSVSRKLYSLGVRRFAVSNIWEAVKLRKCGLEGEILIFGYTGEDFFEEIRQYDLTQTVGSTEYAKQLSGYAVSNDIRLPVHIKVNTGMNRVGIDTEEELDEILSLGGLDCKAAYTHFSCADSLDSTDGEYTAAQQAKLLKIAKDKGLMLHSQNSAGIAYHGDFAADAARAGIVLYGLSPNYPLEVPFKLKNVMTLKSVVQQIKKIPAGTYISYGRTFCSDREMTVAVVPIGYADGYFRDFSSKGQMLINGSLCPVLGRVCMDQTVVDVTDTDVKTGDEVTVYGGGCKEVGTDYNAALIGTIGYELTCAVSCRVPRVIIEGGKPVDVVRYGDMELKP
ncbi:MAG: alanine racemase [Eubacterium sp.]|nr:alanine racemase [Eubacterium sp.]